MNFLVVVHKVSPISLGVYLCNGRSDPCRLLEKQIPDAMEARLRRDVDVALGSQGSDAP